ncbi:hypothetical protein ACH347_14410 [Saccharopolyspora sp. 5N102]|uniref:hypothetical protein n=1 Tax=Saccharopolyspora sp. 5N102 TaxID=3375155 RepID=UPI0037973404
MTATTAGRREWLGLAVLVLPVLLVSMDVTVLYLALPALSAELSPTGTELLWIIDVYSFLLAGLLITMGALGDVIGMLPGAVAAVAGAGLASALGRRVRPTAVVGIGLALTAAGFGVLACVGTGSAPWLIVSGSVLLGAGLTATLSTTVDLIIAAAPPERAGAAGGLVETSEKFGAACGAAVLGAIHSAVYRAGAPAAPETLGSALAEAARLPERAGVLLRDVATHAFVSGMRAAAITCLVLFVVAAFAVLLRRTGD